VDEMGGVGWGGVRRAMVLVKASQIMVADEGRGPSSTQRAWGSSPKRRRGGPSWLPCLLQAAGCKRVRVRERMRERLVAYTPPAQGRLRAGAGACPQAGEGCPPQGGALRGGRRSGCCHLLRSTCATGSKWGWGCEA